MERTILHNVLVNGAVSDIVIADGAIESIGSCQPAGSNAQWVDCSGLVAFPALANTHTHAAMTLFRGYGSGAPLQEWLTRYILPKEKQLTEEMVYWATRLACLEMIKSGTTAFANMYFFNDASAQAVADSGIRAVLGYAVPDRDGSVRIMRSEAPAPAAFMGRCSHSVATAGGRVAFAVAPHSVYALGKDDLKRCAKAAADGNMRLLIHMNETQSEVDDCLKSHGMRPFEYLASLDIPQMLGPRLTAAHCLWLSDNEIDIIGHNHCIVSHCPNSNLKLASGYRFQLKELAAAGALVTLGTDGCSSSDNLDMLEAAKLMTLLQTGWRGDAQALSAHDALRIASQSGYEALGINAGSIEPGKQADIMLVDTDNPSMLPLNDPESNLLYAAHSDAIDSLMCAGRFVMRHREVADEELIKSKVRTLAARLLGGLALLLVLVTVGCRRGDPAEGKMIFRYNESAGITSLDPAYAKDQALIWATTQLYNGLVELSTFSEQPDNGGDLEVRPAIARSWTVSADRKTYTFTLRNDVFFHKNALFNTCDSTRAVTAADFVYSWNRILDPGVASPGLWVFNNVDTFYAVSDTTLVLRLRHPFAPQLSLLAMPYCSVVPCEVVEHYGADFRKHPCGTGPFAFQYWKEGVKLVLRRNPLYFERDSAGTRLPYLDAVAITFIIDRQTAFLEFVKHNLDFMNSLAPSYKDEILTRTGQLKAKYADRIDMVSTPFLNTEYLGFLMDSPQSPVADKRVRQAINYGFDREKMLLYMRNGVGEPGFYGMIPCGLPGYDTATRAYRYNPTRARKLLADAGYPGGKGLPPITLSTTATYLDLCKYIQQQLGLLGIEVRLDVNPPASLRENIAQSKVQWFRGSWIADYPDAENYLSLFTSNNFCPAGPNYTHFSNTAYDTLYSRSCRETDPIARANIYKRMNAIIQEEAPVVVLYYDQILHFTHKNVKGLASNPMNALDLRRVMINQIN